MRFILNFILFGLIFYAIWFFFPEAFNKLVSWAGAVFAFIKDLINSFSERIAPKHEPETPTTTMLLWFFKLI